MMLAIMLLYQVAPSIFDFYTVKHLLSFNYDFQRQSS